MLHCLDVVREALECASPPELIIYNWMRGIDMPQPDFTYKAMCRDFTALKDWQRANQLDPFETVGAWKRKGDEKEVEMPWQWARLNAMAEAEKEKQAMTAD